MEAAVLGAFATELGEVAAVAEGFPGLAEAETESW